MDDTTIEQVLYCGHAPTPDAGPGTGYATDSKGRKHCYQCVYAMDRSFAASMKPTDPPLFAYLKPWPSPDGFRDSRNRIKIITWPGIELGHGFMTDPARDAFGHRVQYVTCTIDGREFHGRHYPDSGDYVRLRPRKGQ